MLWRETYIIQMCGKLQGKLTTPFLRALSSVLHNNTCTVATQNAAQQCDENQTLLV